MALQFVTDQIKNLAITNAKLAGSIGVSKLDSNDIETGTTLTGSASKIASAQAIKGYVDSVAQGLDLKESCKVATTANITLSGTQTIDGVAISADQRVLVKEQTDASQNGIYLCKAGAWSRADDFAVDSDEAGAFTFIEEGTVGADNGYVCTNNKGSAVVGTNDLVFSQFSSAGMITAGAGLTKSGETLNVGAGNGITVNANDVTLNLDGTSLVVGGSGLKVNTGGVTNAMLANSTISGVALGGSLNALTAGDGISMSSYNGSAAVSNLTVALDGSTLAKGGSGLKVNTGGIANNEISASAAIDYSKLAALTSGSILVGNGSNVATVVAMSGDVGISNTGATTIQANAVDTAMVADNAITLAKMAGLARGKIIVGDASGDPAALALGSAHQFFQSDGSDAAWVTMSGDVTLAAGVATIAAGAVHHGMLNDDIISGQGELAHADIADADELMISDAGTIKRVGVDSLRDHYFGAVSGDATIADGGALTIANDAVEQAMIADDAVGADQLAANAVVDASVAANAAIALTKLAAVASGSLVIGNASNQASVQAMSGDATITNAGVLTIAAGAINASKLANNAVDTAAIVDLNVTTGKLADNSVDLSKLGYQADIQSWTGDGNTLEYTLNNRITDASFYKSAMVFRNGQNLVWNDSPGSIDQYKVTDDGSATKITIGANLLSGDTLQVYYIR